MRIALTQPTMLLKPHTASFTFLLGILVALGALSTDIFVPALPELAAVFRADVATVQQSATTFFIGVACGQLVYGPISDRYGRRPPLLAGLALFVAASVFCAGSTSIEQLISGRFVQGLGVSAAPVLARSIVRDLYAWDEAARALALMGIVLGLSPILAPFASTALLAAGGWRSIFWALSAISVAMLAFVAFGLPETASHARKLNGNGSGYGKGGPLALVHNFVFLLGERRYLAYMAVTCIILTGIYAFVSSAAFVIVHALGYSPREFALCFAIVAIGNILGAIASSRLVMRYGMDRMIRIGTVLAFGSGVVMTALAWLRVDHVAATVAPAFVFLFAVNFVIPHATAGALSPYPKISGAASSLLGFIQLAAGAATSYALGATYDGTPLPLAIAFGLAGVASLLAYVFLVLPLPPAVREQ
ncbi:MAG: multidrug effflux MFS transporter [Betaproteobacteria bacterium]|nr:multidrug effflux MFS transporter [Betaproteobacteria bacterium]